MGRVTSADEDRLDLQPRLPPGAFVSSASVSEVETYNDNVIMCLL